MEAPQRINWLDVSTKQIEDCRRNKSEEEKEKSRQTLNALSELEERLITCIRALHGAEQNLMNGGTDCQQPFIQNMQQYMTELSAIGQLSSNLDTMAFPIALCDYIDQGKNPDLQMKQNYIVTQTRNNVQRARIVNTYSVEQYLRNGQQYFDRWKQQKNAQINAMQTNHSKTKPNIEEDEDIDIAMT